MSNPTAISVVICTCHDDRLDRLLDAVDSVRNQSAPAHEIIVVVDHNEPLRTRIAETRADVTVISNRRRKGLSGARNTGVLAASSDIVAFLDDDALASPLWLASLQEAYNSQFTLGAGGPIRPDWPSERPAWWPEEFDWVVGCSYQGEQITDGSTENLIGCNMSYRRKALVLAGLFDEDLGRSGGNAAGCEETELARRARAMFPASQLLFIDGAEVTHRIDAGRDRFSYFVKRCRAEGVSKAMIAAGAIRGSGLSRERSYVLNTLGGAVLRNLGQFIGGQNRWGLHKSAVIVSGLFAAGTSYLWSRLSGVKPVTPDARYLPREVLDIELSRPLPARQSANEDGQTYGALHCVIRQQGRLVTTLEIPTYGETVSDGQLHRDIKAVIPTAPVSQPAPVPASRPALVIVATRDRPDMLARCVRSILAMDYPDFELVIVDSAPSTSATRDLIDREFGDDPRVQYVHERQPGLARAHNAGLAGCTRELIAFTDDDVLVDRGWLNRIAEAFDAAPKVGAVTGAILPAELETEAQYWTESHGGFLKGTQMRLFDLADNKPRSPLFPFTAGMMGSGANMAFSREALEELGSFDPALGAGTIARGGDDLDALFRTVRAGFTVVYTPDALVWHHHRRSADGMERQAHGYGTGLGAYLTKAMLDRPFAGLRLIAMAPLAVQHLFGSKSEKMQRLPVAYPRRFVRAEFKGILGGPLAYWRSRRALHGSRSKGAAKFTQNPVWKGN